MSAEPENVPAECPFESQWVDLDDVELPSGARLDRLRIHFIESGTGAPVLFLHGNPTSSYLWRNVLPAAARHGRAVAIDLMGHGLSDKPACDYSFDDHYTVLCRVIERLNLADGYLVLHDWGGPLGFRYALDHPGSVRGIVAMETFPWPLSWEGMPLVGRLAFRAFRAPGLGVFLLERLNLFVTYVLPNAVARRGAVTREALARYRSFYPTSASRKSLRRWPEQLPLDAQTETWQAVSELERKLPGLECPLLWLAVTPGAVTTQERLDWLRRELPQVEIRHLGAGGHFIQEEIPGRISKEIDAWLAGQVPSDR
ncbi:MAG: haloalkane dehalogenase [Myxococcota bacterium]